jgi:hypothetical protein
MPLEALKLCTMFVSPVADVHELQKRPTESRLITYTCPLCRRSPGGEPDRKIDWAAGAPHPIRDRCPGGSPRKSAPPPDPLLSSSLGRKLL